MGKLVHRNRFFAFLLIGKLRFIIKHVEISTALNGVTQIRKSGIKAVESNDFNVNFLHALF
jgi:hypothetical protein